MLLIDTYIDKSSIHGLGLFAKKAIAKGDVIWEFNEDIDIRISQLHYERLSKSCKKQMDKYTYYENGYYCLDGDDARFINHSDNPNIFFPDEEKDGIALRNIKKGEELTCNYQTFEHRKKWL